MLLSLSPIYQLESAVAKLQALAAYQGALAFGQGIAAQAGFRDLVHGQAVQAAEALTSIGSTIGQGFAERLQGTDPASVYQEMAAGLPGFQARLLTFREISDRSLREEMTRLHRMVGGPTQLFGLPSPMRMREAAPAVPEWAREVRLVYTGRGKRADRETTIDLGPDGVAVIGGGPFSAFLSGSPHTEISYQHGRFWIRDLTSLTGTFLNGRRLPPDIWWPVASQDRVTVGSLLPKKFRVVFPEPPTLASLEQFIAEVDSLENLEARLEMNGLPELALQIERHLRYDEDFSDLPAEGGLEAKILELVLARRFDRLRGQYLEGLREETTRAILEPLVDAVERAAAPEELCEALRRSLLPSGFSIARAIEGYFRGKGSIDSIPTALGIRAKVESLVRRREGGLLDELAAMAELRSELERAVNMAAQQAGELVMAQGRERSLQDRLDGAQAEAIETLRSERDGLEDEARGLRLQVEEKVAEQEGRREQVVLREGRSIAVLDPAVATSYIVGRGGKADIAVNERNVSRRHLEIVWQNDRWMVIGFGQYGARLNGGTLGVKGVHLGDGDRIGLGLATDETVVVFRQEADTNRAFLSLYQEGAQAVPPRPPTAQQPPSATIDPFPVLSITFRPDQRPATGDYLVLGRQSGCDGVFNHKTVSRRHAHLVRNGQAYGQFLADTWYYQRISDSQNVDLHNGRAVVRNEWIPLADGDRLRMGGFPLVVAIGSSGEISFSTDNPPPPPPPAS